MPNVPNPDFVWGRDHLSLDEQISLGGLKPQKVDFEELGRLAKKTSHLFSGTEHDHASEPVEEETPVA